MEKTFVYKKRPGLKFKASKEMIELMETSNLIDDFFKMRAIKELTEKMKELTEEMKELEKEI